MYSFNVKAPLIAYGADRYLSFIPHTYGAKVNTIFSSPPLPLNYSAYGACSRCIKSKFNKIYKKGKM